MPVSGMSWKSILQLFLKSSVTKITSSSSTQKDGGFIEPIRRGQAWKIFSTICKQVGLPGNFGTHSLRKTWGYHARMSGVDLALIMHMLNHESIAYTKR